MRTCFRCDGASEHETSILKAPPSGVSVYITKQTDELEILGQLLKADGRLHVVYVQRDPRAVITSIHQNAPDCYATDYRTWQRCYRFAESLSALSNFYRVRYEDLVCRPDAVQRSVLGRMPWLEQIHSFSAYHEEATPSAEAISALNQMRPVAEDRLKSWLKHLPRIKEELARHPEMTRELIACGYEENASWTHLLDNIPLKHHSVWREKPPSLLKRLDRWQRRRRRIRKYLRAIPTDYANE